MHRQSLTVYSNLVTLYFANRRTVACNGGGGLVGSAVTAYQAGPLTRVVRPSDIKDGVV